jgi:phosphonate transport system ATP-binding protein
VSLHQVEYALRYCSRTIALKHGKIAFDGPSSALSPELLTALYGAESEELFASLQMPGAPRHDTDRTDAIVPLDAARRAQAERRHQAHA